VAAIGAVDDATLLAVPGVTARHVRALRLAFPPPPTSTEPGRTEGAELPTPEPERQPG